MRFEARLDMRCGVSLSKGLLNFIFDCAGGLVTERNAPLGGDEDVEIDPVVSSAVPMPELVIAADQRRFSGRSEV